jgi:hypothetical protein
MISEMEIERPNETDGTIFLDPEQKSPRAQDFEICGRSWILSYVRCRSECWPPRGPVSVPMFGRGERYAVA